MNSGFENFNIIQKNLDKVFYGELDLEKLKKENKFKKIGKLKEYKSLQKLKQ